ncbi:MAG: hypothetical protein F3739_05700 [Nitrospinae bacterium]|nr:hypothetical protein [Nitrospinota bacterium]
MLFATLARGLNYFGEYQNHPNYQDDIEYHPDMKEYIEEPAVGEFITVFLFRHGSVHNQSG